jgi:DNA repair protein RecO (recombination protein O)
VRGDKRRVEGETAFVLHTWPYRETSSIVEVFSLGHGRVPLVARGARRPRSQLRGVLMEFQPLELTWFGQGEMPTLAKAEWLGGQPLLSGRALLSGYYLNELLLRLLAREDAHPQLFDAYRRTLEALAREAGAAPLRRFELTLLREIGYAPVLDHDVASGEAIRAEGMYAYLPERGPVSRTAAPQASLVIPGSALLAMAGGDYRDPETLLHGKLLMRMLIGHHLGGQALNSRRVFIELQEL